VSSYSSSLRAVAFIGRAAAAAAAKGDRPSPACTTPALLDMAALVQHQQQQGQDMFAPFGAHAYATAAAAAAAAMSTGNASRSSGAGRPSSPPQAVPRARQLPAAAISRQPFGEDAADWQDASAAVQVAASPADSEATEQFLDCYSEGELAC
jgi:hypothetical protein